MPFSRSDCRTSKIFPAVPEMPMQPAAAWWLAIRPKTLSLAAVPVMVGNALAWWETGQFRGSVGLATLSAALLIQMGTNLYNDAGDFARGADRSDRLGPPRASAQGWLHPDQVRRGALLAFSGAFLLGIWLASIGGWPIVLLGLLSLSLGYAYTGGPKPLAYTPFGEGFVLLFFGWAAVGGSYYLQGLQLSWQALLAGTVLGLPAAAVLLVNNDRDQEADLRAGRRTLALWLGPLRTRYLYGFLLLAPPVLWSLAGPQPNAYWAGFALIPGLILVRRFWRLRSPSPAHNLLLGATARYQVFLGLLMILGLLRAQL